MGACDDAQAGEDWYDGRCYLEEFPPEDRVRSRRPETSFEPGLWAELTYAHRCSHIDLAPTVLDALGCAAPASMAGEPGALLCGPAEVSRPAFVGFGRYEIGHAGFGGFKPVQAVTDGATSWSSTSWAPTSVTTLRPTPTRW